jgi:hypothetical protein
VQVEDSSGGEDNNAHPVDGTSTENAAEDRCNQHVDDRKRERALYMRQYRARRKLSVVTRRDAVCRREQNEDDGCSNTDDDSPQVATTQKKWQRCAQNMRAFRASLRQRKGKCSIIQW